MSLNCVSFNQDFSQVAVGTSQGLRVYTTDSFERSYHSYEGNVLSMEMLFSTTLIALVPSPRRLMIRNTKRNTTICELTFPTTILGVRINRKRLVVVLENQIYVYDIMNMKLVHTVNTSPNPHGVCVLSPNSENPFLIYPLPQSDNTSPFAEQPSHVPPTAPPHLTSNSGHILIFHPITLQAVNVIEAHRSSLSCLATNREGTKLATASDKGTIIRVFSIPDGQKLFQFRRGSSPARIYSMAFSYDSTLLCVSSATETVHVFKLGPKTEQSPTSPVNERAGPARRVSDRSLREDTPSDVDSSEYDVARNHNGTFAGMIRRSSQNVTKSFASTLGGYLPTVVTEMLEPTRDFAWFKVPRRRGVTTIKSIVGMKPDRPEVMVATTDGDFLVYAINTERGGEAELIKQESIFEPTETTGD